MPLRPPPSASVWSSDGSTVFLLDAYDQALFRRYRDRTLLSITGTPVVNEYGNFTLRAAFEVSSLTASYLNKGTQRVKTSPTAVSLFNAWPIGCSSGA